MSWASGQPFSGGGFAFGDCLSNLSCNLIVQGYWLISVDPHPQHGPMNSRFI